MAYTPAAMSPLPMGITPVASSEGEVQTTLYRLIRSTESLSARFWPLASAARNGAAGVISQTAREADTTVVFMVTVRFLRYIFL